jgi:hypothetical protein
MNTQTQVEHDGDEDENTSHIAMDTNYKSAWTPKREESLMETTTQMEIDFLIWWRPKCNYNMEQRWEIETKARGDDDENKMQRSKNVTTPFWGKCEDETRTPKSGNLESSGTLETLELDCRGQNTLPWGVLYILGKVLKSRCRKWPHRSHSDICNTSYGRKKGQESNWQFDSRPLKVGNRPDPGVCRWSATHHRKALEESYKFALDFISIKSLSWELWAPKVPRV